MTQMAMQQPSNSSAPGIPNPEIQAESLSTKQAQQLARFVNENYSKMKSARSAVERQWYLNMAFYFGRQNVIPQNVKGVGSRLIVPPAPPWRVRMVVNKIRPIVRRELSKLT